MLFVSELTWDDDADDGDCVALMVILTALVMTVIETRLTNSFFCVNFACFCW